MNGGGNSTEICIIDGEVILTYSDAEWWYDDDDITEYKLDKAVLADIESVFRKYKMQNWNDKKFSDMFVADGPVTAIHSNLRMVPEYHFHHRSIRCLIARRWLRLIR